jgi:transposase/DNA-binding XRE family transcriptional regulator
VAVISGSGRDLEDREFPTTPAGYQRALAFIASHGEPIVIGIEGSSSYGVGIASAAAAEGLVVVEVMRPERAERRRLGKSDPIDAYQAARAAMGSHRVAPIKDAAALEGIRALHNARRSAMKARTSAMRQIHSQLITAPTSIRDKYRDMSSEKRLTMLAKMQVPANRTPVERAVLLVLKTLAMRCNDLHREHERLGVELDQLVTAANPGLRAAYGVGPDTAAQLLITAGGNTDRLRSEAAFAALCGTRPHPRVLRQDHPPPVIPRRQRSALVRMSSDPRTKAYMTRQREAGHTSKEILRKLKRAIAREIFRHLSNPTAVPAVEDLRPLRQAKNITVTTAANQLGVWPTTISELERGIRRNDTRVSTYRDWLLTA